MSRESLPVNRELQFLYGLMQEVPSQDYSYLIKETEKYSYAGGVYQGELSEAWWRPFKYDKQMIEVLREVLRGKILVDLGGGSEGHFLKMLHGKRIRPDGYVSVDKYAETKSAEVGLVGNFPVFEIPNGVMVRSDAIDFLSRVPDGSLEAVSINALDDEVIKYPEYHRVLADLASRKMAIGGIFIGYDAPAIRYLLESGKAEVVHEYDMHAEFWGRAHHNKYYSFNFYVLRKIKD